MHSTCRAALFVLTGTMVLGACAGNKAAPAAPPESTLNRVQTLVVIYAENRAFDDLFGSSPTLAADFPGIHGLNEVLDSDGKPTAAYHPQLDRDHRTVLTTLPRTWHGVTAAGQTPVVTEAESAGLPNAPFPIETAFTASSGATLSTGTVTQDTAHRFFENQMQIDGGRNDLFAAWTDAGGVAMGHFDYSHSRLYALARQYVLADNFFQGAFGGSFLNHQYLICACAPVLSADFVAHGKPSLNQLGAPLDGVPQLAVAGTQPSAMSKPPQLKTGNIAPLDYFGAGDGYRAVNTMQPPYQPSGNSPAGSGGSALLYADPAKSTTLQAQTRATIGDLLDAAGLSWKWYAGAWNAAVQDGRQAPSRPRSAIYTPSSPAASPDFQAHHMPFNYYQAFDPGTAAGAANRDAHLKDYTDLVADAAAGTLPTVAFYKPQGNFNQHAGYASLADGDAHIADLVGKLQASPQWPGMMIVITYDEFGGVWDHVAPPKGDLLGPGTRIPAIVVSPLAKQGIVDHTQYDTGSILRFIHRRWGVPLLPGTAARDAALSANGFPAMGDLSNTLR